MSNCPTCKRPISCNCQLKTLSNGQIACTACFQENQSRINVEKAKQLQTQTQVNNQNP